MSYLSRTINANWNLFRTDKLCSSWNKTSRSTNYKVFFRMTLWRIYTIELPSSIRPNILEQFSLHKGMSMLSTFNKTYPTIRYTFVLQHYMIHICTATLYDTHLYCNDHTIQYTFVLQWSYYTIHICTVMIILYDTHLYCNEHTIRYTFLR